MTKTLKRPKKKGLIQTRERHRRGFLRPNDEQFLQDIVGGMTGAESYRRNIATGQIVNQTAQSGAYLLLKKPLFQKRLDEIRESDKRLIEEKLGFGREQIIRYLIDGANTPVGDIDEHHPLCQEYTVTAGEEFSQTKVKMVSKMDCIDKLSKILGVMPQQGGSQGLPQVVINLGAVFSPTPGSTPLTAIRVVDAPPLKLPTSVD